jgi:hypothetical protein
MDKKKLHHFLTLLRHVNLYVLLGLSVVSFFVAALALRSNNQQMIRLRNAVFAADEKNGDTEGALQALRGYVYAHMNTDLSAGANAVKPPIQLKYTYERLVAAEKARYQAETARMLSEAESTCIARHPGNVLSQARLDCAKAYAAAHPVVERKIPEDLYKFDFASPKWSPDGAGWSLVAGVLFFVLFVLRLISEWAIRRELHANS